MEKLAPPSALLNFRPTVRQREQIDRLCTEAGVPRAILLRRALAAYLDRYDLSPNGLGLVEKEHHAPNTE